MLPIKDDQPRYSTPYVNSFLIGINILIFFFQWIQMASDPRAAALFERQFAEVPGHLAAFLAGSPRYTLPQVVIPFFTSMFLHANWRHVLGNMWFLWIFGDNVEDYLGHFKYLVFYLLAGSAGDVDAGGDLSALECADGGRERGDRGSAGSVFPAVSESAGADVVLRVCAVFAGMGGAGRMVRAAVCVGGGDAIGGTGRYGGRGVLGAHWGIYLRDGDDQTVSGAETTVSLRLSVEVRQQKPRRKGR